MWKTKSKVNLDVLRDCDIFFSIEMYNNTLHLIDNKEKVLQILVIEGEVAI